MNAFELSIKNDGNPGVPEYYLLLKIDGEEFLKEIDEDFNVVYFNDLKESSKGPGQFLIFTCSCGIADCGGWDYVTVRHENGKVIWDFQYEQDFHFEFASDQYAEEIAKITDEVADKALVLEPVHAIGPE